MMADDFIWRDRGNWTPQDPDSFTTKQRLERVRAREMHMDDVARRKVPNRNPMPCCGVRADLHDEWGCGR